MLAPSWLYGCYTLLGTKRQCKEAGRGEQVWPILSSSIYTALKEEAWQALVYNSTHLAPACCYYGKTHVQHYLIFHFVKEKKSGLLSSQFRHCTHVVHRLEQAKHSYAYSQNQFLKCFLYFFCVYMWVYMWTIAHMWSSEDKLVLFFHVGPRNRTWVIRFGRKDCYQFRHLTILSL